MEKLIIETVLPIIAGLVVGIYLVKLINYICNR